MNLIAWLAGTWAPGTWASGAWQEAVLSTTTSDSGEFWVVSDSNRRRLIRASYRRDRLVQDEAEIEYLIANGII